MFKKLMILVALLIVASCFAMADNTFTSVTTSVSTLPVVGAGSGTLAVPANLPQISSATIKVYIKKITISNSDAAVPQTITFYDDARTTNTVTAIWQIVIPSGTYQNQVITLDFDNIKPLRADYGLYIRKTDTGSTVSASVLYW